MASAVWSPGWIGVGAGKMAVAGAGAGMLSGNGNGNGNGNHGCIDGLAHNPRGKHVRFGDLILI